MHEPGNEAIDSDAMMVSCQYGFLCHQLQLVSRHVIEVQEIGFKKFGTELRRGWPPADFSWQCYYMLGITTKLSSSGVVVTLERNILLRLSNCN